MVLINFQSYLVGGLDGVFFGGGNVNKTTTGFYHNRYGISAGLFKINPFADDKIYSESNLVIENYTHMTTGWFFFHIVFLSAFLKGIFIMVRL